MANKAEESPCTRHMIHPAHKWMGGRLVFQCPGVDDTTDHERFRLWLVSRRDEWQRFKATEGSLFTFSEYLAARELYLKEISNG